MSEVPQELIQSFYAESTAPHENFAVRLHQHPVFSNALEAQVALSLERVEQKMVPTYWKEHNTIAKRLTEEAKKALLIGKRALLQGQSLIFPEHRVDPVVNTSYIKPKDSDGSLNEALASAFMPNAYKGPFSGFSLRFTDIFENGSRLFIPSISYRVEMGRYESPFFNGHLFVNGDITTSTLEFEEDNAKEKKENARSELLSLAPECYNELLFLERLLETDKPSQLHVKHIAYFCAEILNIVEDERIQYQVRGALSNLLRLFFNDSSAYRMTTNVYINSHQEDTVKTNVRTTELKRPFIFQDYIRGAVFLKNDVLADEAFTLEEGNGLYFVTGDGKTGKYNYIPARHILEFTKK